MDSRMVVEKPVDDCWQECMNRTMELRNLPSSMVEHEPSKPVEQGWWQRKKDCNMMGRCRG